MRGRQTAESQRTQARWPKDLSPSYWICLVVAALIFWVAALMLREGALMEHNVYDSQTLQALQWRKGKIELDNNVPYLEIGVYQNRYYVTFPPVPAVFEFILSFFFEQNTPNTLSLILFGIFAFVLIHWLLRKHGVPGAPATVITAGFCFGTQILYLSVSGAVWHQGQIEGLTFSLLAMVLLEKKNPSVVGSGLCLGLATGCRPDQLFIAPFLIWRLLSKEEILTRGKKIRAKKMFQFFFGLSIVLGPMAAYNFFRFDSPFEFGHKYLPWSQSLPDGIFSFAYLVRNFSHTFLVLPFWDPICNCVSFRGRGTAIWLVEPILLGGFLFFFSRKMSFAGKLAAGVSVLCMWGTLLLHESNGWYQFGYRYGVDLIPLMLGLLALSIKNFQWTRTRLSGLMAFVLITILINVYGVRWYYVIHHAQV